MITLPPEPSAKDPVSATFIKALMRYIRANTILNGPGYRTNRGPNGTTLKIDSVKGKASPVPSYWTFSYPKDVEGEEDEQENDHGKEPEEACWHNCRLQIGYDASFSELECTDGLKEYADGVYYAEVDLLANKWELKRVDGESKSAIPPHDFENSKVNLFVGIVKDKKQEYSINCIPVAYKYV